MYFRTNTFLIADAVLKIFYITLYSIVFWTFYGNIPLPTPFYDAEDSSIFLLGPRKDTRRHITSLKSSTWLFLPFRSLFTTPAAPNQKGLYTPRNWTKSCNAWTEQSGDCEPDFPHKVCATTVVEEYCSFGAVGFLFSPLSLLSLLGRRKSRRHWEEISWKYLALGFMVPIVGLVGIVIPGGYSSWLHSFQISV